MDKFKIAIIVGHEEKKPGAVLNLPGPKVTEYEYNKNVAALINGLAPNYGYDCEVFLRDGIGRSGVKELAWKYGANIILELHFDGAYDPNVAGCTILCAKSYANMPLPKYLGQKLIEIFGGKNRGIKVPTPIENGYFNVKSPVPLYLVEPFFGSNPAQAEIALNSAPSYAKGILDCVKEAYGNGLT